PPHYVCCSHLLFFSSLLPRPPRVTLFPYTTLFRSGVADGFKLLHFHVGSQILDIQNLEQAVKEIARIYATLRKRGLEIDYLNVGGGLGVNYEAGEVTSPHGINYTLPEYVNAIVYTVKEVCDAENVPHPVLVSESGRALTAHHSVLIVEVIAA